MGQDHWSDKPVELSAARRFRRSNRSSDEVVRLLSNYLKEHIKITMADLRRFEHEGERERYSRSRERLAWIEGMLLWIEHNI